METTLNGAVRKALEQYPMNWEFGLWDLKRDVQRLYPGSRNTHADTVSRRLREEKRGKNYGVICIKPHMSRYKKVTAEQFEIFEAVKKVRLANGKKAMEAAKRKKLLKIRQKKKGAA